MRNRTWLSVLAGCLFASTTSISLAQTNLGPSHLAGLKAGYKREPVVPIATQTLVDLGRDLFFEKALSASGKTACVTCHLPELGWGVAEAKSRNDSGQLTSRHSQSLLAGYGGTAPIGWDGRNPTLEAQAKASIVSGSMSMSQTPTPVKVEVIEERFRSNPGYVAKFKAALPGCRDQHRYHRAGDRRLRAHARARHRAVRPLDRGRRRRDLGIGQARASPSSTTKRCALRAIADTRFTDDLFHDIGTTTTDPGRGRVDKDNPHAQFAFKTPTLARDQPAAALHAQRIAAPRSTRSCGITNEAASIARAARR